MKRTVFRAVAALAAVAAFGVLVNAGTLRADDNRNNNNRNNNDDNLKNNDGRSRPGETIPPQTLRQGFESHRDLAHDANPSRRTTQYSAWIVESSRFMDVPFRAFMPDRNDPPVVNLPVNVGIIKGPPSRRGRNDGDIILYDTGWKQDSYIYDWNSSCCAARLPQQMTSIGLDPSKVKHIVLGHAHWDHAGQISDFPKAKVWIQREELKQIDFFLAYPLQFNDGNIHAVNTVERHSYSNRQDLVAGGGTPQTPPNQACARSPVCGYPPQTLQEIFRAVMEGRAHIIDGRHEIADGLIIHPAFRGHTYGSQLLQVNTSIGQLVFGSDTYSSWEGIRDWNVANIQQTDTIQQMLAYEKCHALTSATPLSADGRRGGYNNCIAAHEPKSYSDDYPITANWWAINGGNCSRAAELVLSNGELTHRNGPQTYCEVPRFTPGTFGYQK